jgi:hypothetical protein
VCVCVCVCVCECVCAYPRHETLFIKRRPFSDTLVYRRHIKEDTMQVWLDLHAGTSSILIRDAYTRHMHTFEYYDQL